MCLWKKQLIKGASACNFPIHKSIIDLTPDQNNILWNGNEYFLGIKAFFKDIESQTYKIQYRVMLAKFRGRTACDQCNGTRLRPDTEYVKIADKSIGNLLQMNIKNLFEHFQQYKPSKQDTQIASRILLEINNRLQFMVDVGLEYLSLNRFSNTLSCCESQRINLTRSLGSNLTGSLYILDEPSVGLHPHDTGRLINILKYLRDLGITRFAVEADPSIEPAVPAQRRRPDRSRALQQTFASAAAYDKWFNGEVSAAVAEADHPSTQWVSGESASSAWARRRKALLAQ